MLFEYVVLGVLYERTALPLVVALCHRRGVACRRQDDDSAHTLPPGVDAYCHLLLADEDDEAQALQQPDKNELQNTLRTLGAKMEDLNTCNDLITKHGATLQKALGELEALDPGSHDLSSKIKSVNERATLFRITSNAMINVSIAVSIVAVSIVNVAVEYRRSLYCCT